MAPLGLQSCPLHPWNLGALVIPARLPGRRTAAWTPLWKRRCPVPMNPYRSYEDFSRIPSASRRRRSLRHCSSQPCFVSCTFYTPICLPFSLDEMKFSPKASLRGGGGREGGTWNAAFIPAAGMSGELGFNVSCGSA